MILKESNKEYTLFFCKAFNFFIKYILILFFLFNASYVLPTTMPTQIYALYLGISKKKNHKTIKMKVKIYHNTIKQIEKFSHMANKEFILCCPATLGHRTCPGVGIHSNIPLNKN